MSTRKKSKAKKRHPETGILVKAKKARLSPVELAKADAAAGRRRTGPTSVVDSNDTWREYIDTCAEEIKSGRSDMSLSQIHDGLVSHFNYPYSYSTVREYVYKVHGKPGAWRNG